MAKNFEDIITRFVRVHQSERQTDRQTNSMACHPQPPATMQGAATWQIQRHVIPEPHITLQGAATW